MPSTSNKPVSTHDQGPEEKAKKDLPNREDAADREILPVDETQSEEEVVDTTGYVSNTGEEEPAAEGDPDSIAAFKQVQEEAKAAEEAKTEE